MLFRSYTGFYKGVPVSVQGTGMGMPSMGIYSWELITEYGVKNLIRIGTAGSFRKDIKLGDLILATSASTDSNFHHSFKVPVGYAPCADWTLMKKVYETNKELKFKLKAGNVVSCDVFYETVTDWWKAWADMGVLAVEMEAAALYMNCAYHNVSGLALVTITDEFTSGKKATGEERLVANENMFKLALEAIIK